MSNTTDDLIISYGNALDLTSIVKIALIEHWKNQTGATARNATESEARITPSATLPPLDEGNFPFRILS